jgi:hypothetical protein
MPPARRPHTARIATAVTAVCLVGAMTGLASAISSGLSHPPPAYACAFSEPPVVAEPADCAAQVPGFAWHTAPAPIELPATGERLDCARWKGPRC